MTPSFDSLVTATAHEEGRYSVRIVNGPNGCSIKCADLEFVKKQRKAVTAKKKATPTDEREFDASRAARRTGKNIVKTLHEIEKWDGFLTLYVPTTRNAVDLAESKRSALSRRLIELKDCLAHFAKEYVSEYPFGWFVYWFEVNKFDQIHVHACVKSGLSPRKFAEWATPVWRNICRTKFHAISLMRTGKRPVKVTPYHPSQVGYASRKRKWQCRVTLAGIANDQKVKTTGIIGKKNCQFAQAQRVTVNRTTFMRIADAISEDLKQGCMNRTIAPTPAGSSKLTHGQPALNILQLARVRGGNFWHGFVSEELWAKIAQLLSSARHSPPERPQGMSQGQRSPFAELAA